MEAGFGCVTVGAHCPQLSESCCLEKLAVQKRNRMRFVFLSVATTQNKTPVD